MPLDANSNGTTVWGNVGLQDAVMAPGGVDVSQAVAGSLPQMKLVRTLASRFSDRMSVLDFGVSGTGHDELPLLQAAINVCAGNCSLLIPAGMTISIGGTLSLITGTDLIINGGLFQLPTASGGGIHVNGSNVSVRSDTLGKIDGNRTNQGAVTQWGIGTGVTQNISNVLVSGLEICNWRNAPVNFTSGCSNVVIERCVLHDCGNSAGIAGAGSKNGHFIYCTVYNIADLGIGIYGGPQNCSVQFCEVYACLEGVYVLSDAPQPAICSDVLLAHNYTHNNTGSGVTVANNDPNTSDARIHKRVRIVGNYVENNGSIGIGANFCDDLIISGNHLTGNAYKATGVTGFSGDIFADVGTSHVIISENVVLNTQLGSTLGYGIVCEANVGIVCNNLVDDTQSTKTLAGCYAGGTRGGRITAMGNRWLAGIGAPDQFNYTSSNGCTGHNIVAGVGTVVNGSVSFTDSTTFAGISAFTKNIGGMTAGFTHQGVTFGFNFSAGVGESDIICSGGTAAGAWNGLYILGADNTGTLVTGPLAHGAFAAIDRTGMFQAGAGFQQGSSGQTWTAGIGAPTSVQPNASMYSRKDGATGTRIYVSNGATWLPIPGV